MGYAEAASEGSAERALAALHPDVREATIKRFSEIVRKVGPYELELHLLTADGTHRWLLDRGETVGPIDSETGLAARLTGTVIDITGRKEKEQRIRLLMLEVTHRSKNLLSLVLAIARRTVTSNPKEFLERFNERVLALSASHDLLVDNDWRGIDLASLVKVQLAHFGGGLEDRVMVRGPPVRLRAAAAQNIGMALHELATNAGKYGALSGATGKVAINWEMFDDAGVASMRVIWCESDGPRAAEPQREGFGTLVTGQILASSLSARIQRDYTETGFSWRLECPASAVLDDELGLPT